jgi:hypothetical protein
LTLAEVVIIQGHLLRLVLHINRFTIPLLNAICKAKALAVIKTL